MFGPAFLVNPVTEQLYTSANATPGEKTRKVYLPASTKGYDFWTGKLLNGGQTLDAEAPMDILPLYIKAGSIVPMGPDMEYATEKPASEIELRIYPGANGQFKFYEDENDNYNYEKGKFATFTLTWNDTEHKLLVSAAKGSFPGMLKQRSFNIVLVNGKHGSGPGITAKANRRVIYDGTPLEVKL